jgi:hypothetical protein
MARSAATNTTPSFNNSKKDTNNRKLVLRTRALHDRSKEVLGPSADFYLQRMREAKANGFYRESMFGREIIKSGCKYSFASKKAKKDRRHVFIFAMVKKDAVNYLKQHRVKKFEKLPAIQYNRSVDIARKKLVGTDVDGAYWMIAFQMGVISQSTFAHGLRIKAKHLCLAALASLGADKTWLKIKNGEFTDEMVVIKGDDKLKNLYQSIRMTCFTYMQDLARLLGSDFVAYKTDCIYYVGKKENIQLVQHYFSEKKMDFKMVKDTELDLNAEK